MVIINNIYLFPYLTVGAQTKIELFRFINVVFLARSTSEVCCSWGGPSLAGEEPSLYGYGKNKSRLQRIVRELLYLYTTKLSDLALWPLKQKTMPKVGSQKKWRHCLIFILLWYLHFPSMFHCVVRDKQSDPSSFVLWTILELRVKPSASKIDLGSLENVLGAVPSSKDFVAFPWCAFHFMSCLMPCWYDIYFLLYKTHAVFPAVAVTS